MYQSINHINLFRNILLNIIQQLILTKANHVEYSQKSNCETLKYTFHNLIKYAQDIKTC